MLNRYQGNTGRVVRIDDSQPPPRPCVTAGTDAAAPTGTAHRACAGRSTWKAACGPGSRRKKSRPWAIDPASRSEALPVAFRFVQRDALAGGSPAGATRRTDS